MNEFDKVYEMVLFHKGKFSPDDYDCILFALEYLSGFNTNFLEAVDSYMEKDGERKCVNTCEELNQDDHEKFERGLRIIIVIYAKYFRGYGQSKQKQGKASKKINQEKLAVLPVRQLPRFIPNAIKGKQTDQRSSYNIDQLGKYELVLFIYLFNQFIRDMGRHYSDTYKPGDEIVLDYDHIIKTAGLEKTHDAKVYLIKAIEILSETKINVVLNATEYRTIHILSVKRNIETDIITGVYLHPEARIAGSEFKKFVSIDVDIYKLIRETKSARTILYITKFIDISKSNREFNQYLNVTAKILNEDISVRVYKHRFKERLKECFEIMKRNGLIENFRMVKEHVSVTFTKRGLGLSDDNGTNI
jgi:hypothetical protein